MVGLRAEDAIQDSWLKIYNKQRDILHSQLLTFNTNIFTLERIETFPFDVFLPMYDDRIFWQTTRNALVEATIMIAWRIIVDTDGETMTLRRFKNEIFQNLSSDDVKQKLGVLLKKVDFENRIAALEEKITNARHNYLAHLNKEAHLNPDAKQISKMAISLIDMRLLLDTARELFDSLCFTNRYSLWLWAYSDNAREKRTTDVDKLLDDVAKNSRILNLPEQNPDSFERRLNKMSLANLQIINNYRRKFNLPEIPVDDFVE